MHEISKDDLKSLGKTRCWWAVGYFKENENDNWCLPDNWMQLLEETHIPAFISPIHQFDVNADGTPKKKHIHIMLCFDNTTTATVAYAILHDLLHCATSKHQLKCFSTKGCARYLIHWDNPEKFQYDFSQVISLSGADYELACELTLDWVNVSMEVCSFIDDNNVICYADLVRYCMHRNVSWYKCVAQHTLFFREYIKSNCWKITKSGKEPDLIMQSKIVYDIE